MVSFSAQLILDIRIEVDGTGSPLPQTMNCNPRVNQSLPLFPGRNDNWLEDTQYTGTGTLASSSCSCKTRKGVQELNPRDTLPRSVDSPLDAIVLRQLFPHFSAEQNQIGSECGMKYRDQAYTKCVAGYSMARNYDEFLNEARSEETGHNSTRFSGKSTVENHEETANSNGLKQ